MDPNANLKELLQLAADFQDEKFKGLDLTSTGERMAELVFALDEWLAKGGFLPARWNEHR